MVRRSNAPFYRTERRGITLIEMLVAMAITLVMMAAVVTLFDQLGSGINDSRSIVEMSGRLSIVRDSVQTDLTRITCTTLSKISPEAGTGYFEYIEGLRRDTWIDISGDGQRDLFEPQPTLLNVYSDSVDSTKLVDLEDPASPVDLSALGDADDVLMFTARSRVEPFVGRGVQIPKELKELGELAKPGMVESQAAEVIWCALEDSSGMRTLRRRVLLVAPWLMPYIPKIDLDELSLYEFQTKYDLSARVDATGIRLNSLSDLAKRENRFLHKPIAFPHAYPVATVSGMNISFSRGSGGSIRASGNGFQGSGFQPGMVISVTGSAKNDGLHTIAAVAPASLALTKPVQAEAPGNLVSVSATPTLSGFRQSEDVVMTNVLAFDVRVFDPGAPLFDVGGATVAPGDPGYTSTFVASTYYPVGYGAYVDLNYRIPPYSVPDDGEPQKLFFGPPNPLSQILVPTYGTWPIHYEHDGINQDRVVDQQVDGVTDLFDEGTDGFDNDGVFGVDDVGERETAPPYAAPLRGIQVRIRAYDPDSRQIREVTVQQSFLPE